MPRVLFEDFKRLGEVADIEFIKYGLFCGTDWNYTDLTSPYNRLYILLDGEGYIRTKEREYKLRKGYAYLIPQDLYFSTKTIVGMKKLFVHFNMGSYFHIDMMSGISEVLETQIPVESYEMFADSLVEGEIQNYLRIKGALIELIYDLRSQLDIRLYEDQIKDMPPILHDLYKLLQINLTGKTRIGPLADMLGTSQSMLSKVFKSATGITLKNYMKQQLMTKAQIQLLSTNNTIQEIAYSLEYEDPLYFSRLFHQWTGLSPTKYRKINKTKI